MPAKADAACGAAHGQRSPDRDNSRNGYRPREWDHLGRRRAMTCEDAKP
jgi:transposase-like protein